MIRVAREVLDAKLCAELLPLLKESRDEVYMIKKDKTLGESMRLDDFESSNVNFAYYLEKERQGLFHVSALRDGPKLVGHWALTLNFHGQSKNLLIANCENLHILKGYRGGNNAKLLMGHAEESLRKRGVKQIYFGVNPQLKTDLLLMRAGWSPDEIVFTKGL